MHLFSEYKSMTAITLGAFFSSTEPTIESVNADPITWTFRYLQHCLSMDNCTFSLKVYPILTCTPLEHL